MERILTNCCLVVRGVLNKKTHEFGVGGQHDGMSRKGSDESSTETFVETSKTFNFVEMTNHMDERLRR